MAHCIRCSRPFAEGSAGEFESTHADINDDRSISRFWFRCRLAFGTPSPQSWRCCPSRSSHAIRSSSCKWIMLRQRMRQGSLPWGFHRHLWRRCFLGSRGSQSDGLSPSFEATKNKLSKHVMLSNQVDQHQAARHRAFVDEVASGTASWNEKKQTPALPFTPRHLPKYVLSNGSPKRASGVRKDHRLLFCQACYAIIRLAFSRYASVGHVI
jgi:hypothetical protein